MQRNFGKYITALLGILILTLNGCGKTPQLNVKDAVLILSPVDTNPSALYFYVQGGPEDVVLRSILSPSVIRTEIHKSSKNDADGTVSMEKISEVPIPAGEKVEFKRGGYHGMVWGANLIARRTGEMEVQFTFSNGDIIRVMADVQELDGSAPDERKALGYD